MVLVPHDTGCGCATDGPHRLMFLRFPHEAARRLVERATGRAGLDLNVVVGNAVFRDPLVWHLGQRLWTEAAAGDDVGRLFADGVFLTLVAALLRRASGGTAERPPRGALAPWRLRRMLDRIEAAIGDDLSLVSLAAEAGVGVSAFSRGFKAATGLPPHRYVRERRVERAKALLAQGELPVTEVAGLCGFSSPQYLATAFKRLAGTTPGRWRAGWEA